MDGEKTRSATGSRSRQEPRPLFSCWPEVRARIRAAGQLAVLLDFDGTLVGLRRRPSDVRVPRSVKGVLQRLARQQNVHVAIVSGRSLRDLHTMLEVEGVHVFGSHGAEMKGKKTALGSATRRALAHARRDVRTQLEVLPRIWVEDKLVSLAVHYRGARPAIVRDAHAALLRILAPLRRTLSVMNGKKVWEIQARDVAGKGARVRKLVGALPARALAIYAGDDVTDESAFAAMPNQITIHVGRRADTHARFRLQNPAEVLRFLTRLERELR
ncbi:MAG: trehalose-phosphatase [Candidatus Acidiferrales bacterium]